MTVRAVFIATGLSTGGAEMMLLKLLSHLNRNRFEPLVISLADKGDIGVRIEALGIPVECLGMRPNVVSPFRFLRLVRRLRELQPGLVHTWMYHADLLGGLAARLAGIRAIGWGVRHSNLEPALNKRTTLWVVAICALMSSWLPRRILSCSEKARSAHVAAGYASDKMVVVPNGFDLSRFKPDPAARESVRAELGVGSATLLVGLIARHNPQKNFEGFIEAAAAVSRQRADVHFLLAGSGVDTGNVALQAVIRDTPAADRFHLLGRRDDVPRLMAALDVLVSSSHGEAFPNVVGEAMACGVPCVVTDTGDAAEIVGDTGRIVPAGDVRGLVRELLAVLDLPRLERRALGIRARERVREKYAIELVVRQYEAFYASLMDRADTCVE